MKLTDTGHIVPLPEGVVMHLCRRGAGEEPAQPQALLPPDLIALCQILPIPANLISIAILPVAMYKV